MRSRSRGDDSSRAPSGRSAVRVGFGTCTLFIAFHLFAAGAPSTPRFRVVVNAANPVRSFRKAELIRIFLKKTDWPSHAPVLPVDLPEESEVRKAFSATVLAREVGSINSYWQSMIFSGRSTPPVSVSSDEEVMKYVRLHPTAVGYVSGSTALEAGVVELAIKEGQ